MKLAKTITYATDIVTIDDGQDQSSFDERLEIFDALMKNWVSGQCPGIVVHGDPGTGKSTKVRKCLEAAKFTKQLWEDSEKPKKQLRKDNELFSYDEKTDEGNVYVCLSGKVTPKALFDLLRNYSNSNQAIVLDDADDVLKDDITRNLLKAALNTDAREREVTWASDSERSAGVPRQFEFQGRLAVITNSDPKKLLGEAVYTRVNVIDLSMTNNEKLLQMERMINENIVWEQWKISKDTASKAYDFIAKQYKNKPSINFNIRTFERISKDILSVPDKWQMLAKFYLDPK